MFNLKQPFSRLPIFQGVEMITPTLLTTLFLFILKFKDLSKIYLGRQTKILLPPGYVPASDVAMMTS